jgi:methylenetetrahydrofolate dehydrogenase (NADP+)/methenyltetrahydrofolate cyclohydrolase
VPAQPLDGRVTAAAIRAEVAAEAAAFRQRTGVTPTLAVVYAGDDPANRSYVRAIAGQARRAGLAAREVVLDAGGGDAALRAAVRAQNADGAVHGVIVMVPLPAGMSPTVAQDALDPRKDVDGITASNAGRLMLNAPGLFPATPLGGMELLRRYGIGVTGMDATVVGRSAIVGRPMALLLLHANATVTLCHTRTRDLAAHCRRADLLCVATGVPGAVTAEMIKPGAVVVDLAPIPAPMAPWSAILTTRRRRGWPGGWRPVLAAPAP